MFFFKKYMLLKAMHTDIKKLYNENQELQKKIKIDSN